MHPEAPAAKRFKLENGNARNVHSVPDIGDGIARQDSPESPLTDAPPSIPAGSAIRAAYLPEEILLQIFEYIVPVEEDERVHSKDTAKSAELDGKTNIAAKRSSSSWNPLEILNVALTCRRFQRLILPYLAASFEDWCYQASKAEDRNGQLSRMAAGLRAILRWPVPGTYLRHVEVNVQSFETSMSTAECNKWQATDCALVRQLNKV